ncbi:MAG: hypothetical protein ACR2PX_22590 [Endozoicomonas sp.]|uniref:hypothetical protein n=1 Tax=Endozoicomonas sp. TaxID=1892382 RepID=UPI003D9B289C
MWLMPVVIPAAVAVTYYRHKCQFLEGQLCDKDATLQKNDEQAGALGYELRKKDELLQQAKEQATALERQLRDKDATLQQMKEQATALERQLRDKDATLQKNDEQATALERQLRDKDATLQQKKGLIANLEKQLETAEKNAQKESDRHKTRIEHLTKVKKEMIQKRDESFAEIQLINKELMIDKRKLERQQVEFKRKLSESQDKYREAQEQLKKLKEENEVLDFELNEIKAHLEDLKEKKVLDAEVQTTDLKKMRDVAIQVKAPEATIHKPDAVGRQTMPKKPSDETYMPAAQQTCNFEHNSGNGNGGRTRSNQRGGVPYSPEFRPGGSKRTCPEQNQRKSTFKLQ